jgi:LysM repeat protein
MGDGVWRSAAGLRDQRCGAVAPPAPLTIEKQRRLCVTAEHLACSTFIAADPQGVEALASEGARGRAAGSTRWALARTASLVLEDGAPLPFATPVLASRLGDQGSETGLPRRGVGGTTVVATAGEGSGRGLAGAASARLRGIGQRVAAVPAAWVDDAATRLAALKAGRPHLGIAARAQRATRAVTAARQRAAARLSIATLPKRIAFGEMVPRSSARRPRSGWLPRVALPQLAPSRVTLPSLRLPAFVGERAPTRENAAATGSLRHMTPSVRLRAMPARATTRDPRSPLGSLRVAGAADRRSPASLSSRTKAGGLVAAALGVVAVAAFAAQPADRAPSAPLGAASVATGEVLGGYASAPPPSPAAARAAELVTPSPPRPLPSAAASSPAGETYTVEAGDTLFEIARRFDTTIDELQRLNRLPSADLIEVGQVLSLP